MSKFLLFIIFLCGLSTSVFAFKVEGYIVTLKSDTIRGYVQLSKFDQVTGGFVLNGIEEESFHSRVVFAAQNEKRFQTYFPEMILGFGFEYESTDYVFKQIVIQRKSIFKSERLQYSFMRLVYDEENGCRYKDIRKMPNPGLDSNSDLYLKYNLNLFRLKKKAIMNEKKDSLKSL